MVKSLDGIPLFFLLIIIKFIGVLQDKRCEEEFEKYYIASQERCEGFGVKEQDLPPPKRRRVYHVRLMIERLSIIIQLENRNLKLKFIIGLLM